MFDTRNDLPAGARTQVIGHVEDHVDELAERVTALGGTARISRGTDKDLWFLEAHLHAKR